LRGKLFDNLHETWEGKKHVCKYCKKEAEFRLDFDLGLNAPSTVFVVLDCFFH